MSDTKGTYYKRLPFFNDVFLCVLYIIFGLIQIVIINNAEISSILLGAVILGSIVLILQIFPIFYEYRNRREKDQKGLAWIVFMLVLFFTIILIISGCLNYYRASAANDQITIWSAIISYSINCLMVSLYLLGRLASVGLLSAQNKKVLCFIFLPWIVNYLGTLAASYIFYTQWSAWNQYSIFSGDIYGIKSILYGYILLITIYYIYKQGKQQPEPSQPELEQVLSRQV